MQLATSDFQRLVDIVKDHPDFKTTRGRVGLMQRAFAGSARGNALLSIVNLEDDPRTVATEVVVKVTQFGQLDYGRPALAVFLSSIQNDVGDDEAAFIDELFRKYPLQDQPVRARPIPSWKDPGDDPTERIIDENTLLPISVLEAALLAARAVVRIRVEPAGEKGWVGTGFLVARNLVMTCNHVIPNRDLLGAATCEFNYQLDVAGRELLVNEAQPKRNGRFNTDPDVDFSVFELKAAVTSELATPLRFAKKTAREGLRVAIIQHPGGRPKHISMHKNRVTYADARIVQYVTSTEPGSSGSPVFDNATFEVVAVHNKGGKLPVPGQHGLYLRNEGSSARAILEWLKTRGPDIYQQLTAGS